mgnify:FL=1
MLNISGLKEGIVLDHIEAGKSWIFTITWALTN